jgi:hypothetical protein
MARLSRAERKRINARASAGVVTESGVLPASPLLDEPAVADAHHVVTPAVDQPTRLIRSARRMAARASGRHHDIESEYALISHDLRRIAIWGSILVVLMVALSMANLF